MSQVTSFVSKQRNFFIFGGVLSSALIALQLNVHREIRFKSLPLFISLAQSENFPAKKIGTYMLFRLSRDYETTKYLGHVGLIEILGNLLDKQLENPETLEETTKYIYGCLNNLSRYPPHKLELVVQSWLKRYRDTIQLLEIRKENEDIDATLLCYACFLSTLSTYSRVETATILAYGGIGECLKKEVELHTPKKLSELPSSVRMLILDQYEHSFSAPLSLIPTKPNIATSAVSINFHPSRPEDDLAVFALVTIAELCRHGYARDYLVNNNILELLSKIPINSTDDLVTKPLFIRALAFIAKNDAAKQDICKTWLSKIPIWSEDSNRQTLVFTAILTAVLFENPESASMVVSQLDKPAIDNILRHIDYSPSDLLRNHLKQSPELINTPKE